MATPTPTTALRAGERARPRAPTLLRPTTRPPGPVTLAIRAVQAEAIPLDTARLVRLAGTMRHLHERLDLLMGATGPDLRPAIEETIEALIASLDARDGDPDLKDGHDAEDVRQAVFFEVAA